MGYADYDPEDALYTTDRRGRLLRLIPEHGEQVADALERLAVELERTDKDLGAWKWAIIAAHSAVQNALAHVAGTEAASDPSDLAKAYREYTKALNTGERADTGTILAVLERLIKEGKPLGYLGKFEELWVIVKKRHGLQADGDEDGAIHDLNRERNKFVHLGGDVSDFNLQPYPSIVLACLSIVDYLGWKTSFILWLPNRKERARAALDQCLEILDRLKRDYSTSN